MKYAPVSWPGAPSGGLTAGIDWASADHAVCVVGAAGEVVSRFSVAHTAEGLRALVSRLARAGVREAAIERGDGPVVDALLAAGVTVVVITPRQIKNLRSRYGSAGNKDDRLRRVCAGRCAAHRPGPAAAADPRQPSHRHAAPSLPRPPGPGAPPGRGGQPAARPPVVRLPRRGWPVS
jgi:transposase